MPEDTDHSRDTEQENAKSFSHQEGDAELQDPDLHLEASSSSLRVLWAKWKCQKGGGAFTDVTLFGKRVWGVAAPAVPALQALEQALISAGYRSSDPQVYNCRLIDNSTEYSLHSYGIAVDLDPSKNPFTKGDKYSGAIKANHVAAVLAIKNSRGASVWSWGGNWSPKPDRMHFQLDQGPTAVDVDWSTVSGGKGGSPSAPATAPSSAGGSTYVVQAGDLLRDIATSHGSTVAAFVDANPDMDPDHIFPGQRLTVPGAKPASKPASAPKPGKPSAAKSSKTYVVQPGDTLKEIAADAGTTLTKLLAANPDLANPDEIRPGQTINLK